METTAAPQVLHLDKSINTSLLHPPLEIHSCIYSHVLKLLSVYTGALLHVLILVIVYSQCEYKNEK